MSSQEEHSDGTHLKSTNKARKKRRIGRACDLCRQKKVRCDGEQRPGKRCSNCTAYDDECTYVRSAPKRRSRPKGYTEQLEKRLAKMEELLATLCPETDFTRDFEAMLAEANKGSDHEGDHEEDTEGEAPVRSPGVDTSFDYAIPPSLATHTSMQHSPLTDAPEGDDEDLLSSGDELLTRHALAQQLSGLSLEDVKLDRRFFGKSSTFMMVKKAADLKKQHQPESSNSSPEPALNKSGLTYPSITDARGVSYLRCGCPDYGNFNPWAITIPPYTSHLYECFIFPPADLLPSLVALYFTMHNNYTPVLHRPTFERMVAEGRHMTDEDFASIVLLVSAIGSRWSNDRRVLLDEQARVDDDDDGEDHEEWHSAGWKWFKQVRLGRRALFSPPSLMDIQVVCLASIYLRGSSTSEAARTLIGVGLRLSQDIGAHRKKMYSSLPPVEGEMLKRAFWCLVWLDSVMSPQLGRPCGIQYEDFDLDLPVECDDEYWVQDGNALYFVQPPDKEPTVAYFNCFLRLNQIQAFAMRTVYSTTKSKTILGFIGPQWEERIVADLDSALNNWMDSIPTHLRWDPRGSNLTFLSQSAVLYAAYCALQITIHRPFISYTRALPSTPLLAAEASRLPSLTICVNAAKSCVHVLDMAWQRLGKTSEAAAVVLHYCLIPVFNCGIVLMLNMLGKAEANRSNPNRNARNMMSDMKEMADVHSVMDMLHFIETRWHTAGKLWDMLYELAVVGELPLPSYSHASVIRSSKQGIYKTTSRPSTNSQGPLVPPVKNLLNGNGSKLPPNANPKYRQHIISLERSAIHQALYPKHAHLFQTHPTRTSPEWDLSPSMFTQDSDSPDSINQAIDPQRIIEAPDSTPRTIPKMLSRSEQDASETLSMALGQEQWQAGPSGPSASGVAMVPEAYWEAPFTEAELTAFQQLHTANAGREVPLTDSYSDLAADAALIFAPPDDEGMSMNEQPSNGLDAFMQGNAAPSTSANHVEQQFGHEVTAFPTSSDFLAAGVLPDSEGEATLAMWSNVPTNFDWENWGSYINSLGNPATPDFTPPAPPPSGGMYNKTQ
ncbi:fungal-specific transcription factor domain-containing protein [Irpex rosettiformis]|uniref:Fungal-specific transcription factor domain-containing protein n=1 Tax=Irpex rosettiformis TaxID=378272 RepID=A0ACB8U9K1_9APHY|nr:fungal-specific transcription factor domain-containing protein [Irpex rosettiformis]